MEVVNYGYRIGKKTKRETLVCNDPGLCVILKGTPDGNQMIASGKGGAMGATIKSVEYYLTTARDRPGEAYELLSKLASEEVNLLAFNAVPVGPEHTQLTLFPEHSQKLMRTAGKVGIALTGPHHAFLIQGDDQLGALVDIHRKLYDAHINIYASTGVTDGRGGYGYVIYTRGDDHEQAKRVLDV
jgi:hypothetical protein